MHPPTGRGVAIAAATPVVVTCHLCDPPDHIVTLADHAWTVAVDHALDGHFAELAAAFDDAMAAFTVAADGPPAILRRTATTKGPTP